MNRHKISTLEQNLIRRAKERFSALFGSTEYHFEDCTWDVSPLKLGTYNGPKAYVLFKHLCISKEPLPSHLSNLIKAFMLLGNKANMARSSSKINSLRSSCDALVNKYGPGAPSFHWSQLNDEHFALAESFMATHLHSDNTHRGMLNLLEFAKFLAKEGICQKPDYVPRTPRSPQARQIVFEQPNEDGQLPTQAALEGLADIYHSPVRLQDSLLISAIAITIAGGFRISEVLSLHIDCAVEGTKGRLGLRYHEVKTAKGRDSVQIRWITPAFVPLVRNALERIQELTQNARKQARLLEENPDTVPIPEWEGKETVTASEIRTLWGRKREGHIPKGIPRYGSGKRTYYIVADIQQWLFAQREPLVTLRYADGTVQTLSQTLFITPLRYFRQNYSGIPHIVRQVRYADVQYFLGSGDSYSAFARYGITEADGSICRMTPHQLRHWTTDTANKGGLSIQQLDLWMKRQSPDNIFHYLKSTLDERRKQLPRDIEDGNAYGPLVDLHQHSPALANSILEGNTNGCIYVTPYGLCVHDLYSAPCPYHLACVRECPDYILVKGDSEALRNLHDQKEALEQILKQNHALYDKHPHPNLLKRIEQNQETLTQVKKALTFLNDSSIPVGTEHRPHAFIAADEISVNEYVHSATADDQQKGENIHGT